MNWEEDEEEDFFVDKLAMMEDVSGNADIDDSPDTGDGSSCLGSDERDMDAAAGETSEVEHWDFNISWKNGKRQRLG